jgi:ribose/xylose/arabinose/galactoside ABC-type transport system permease subunit
MHNERRIVLSLSLFIIALFVAASIKDRSFLSLKNLLDIAVNSSYVAIAALGMFVVILSGQIDVSVGAILAVTSTVAGALSKQGLPVFVPILAALATGSALGMLNGSIVVGLGIHSIVATLGTLSIYRGLLIYFTHGGWIIGIPDSLQFLGRGSIGGFPIAVVFTLVIFLLIAWVLRYTRLGRDIYALGSNSESARLAGIRVRRVQLIPFLLNGALVGLAGVIFAGRFGTVQPNTGQGFELIVIAAVVVGGANIFGGSGASAGTVLGALLVSVMGTLLIFFSVNAFWEEAVQGGIILFSVAYYTIRQNRTVVRGITTSATSDSSRRE